MATLTILATVLIHSATAHNLVTNSSFDTAGTSKLAPAGFELRGAAKWAFVGYADETALKGVALKSYPAENSGQVSQTITGIDQSKGKWLRFTFRGRAEEGFSVKSNQLYMKIDFLSKNGTNLIDSAKRLVYHEILNDRKAFTSNGDNHEHGSVVWRTYEFEELLPFPEVDSVGLTVGFEGGNSASEASSKFFVTDFCLEQNQNSVTGKVEPTAKAQQEGLASTEGLIPLGGRWFYKAVPGETVSLNSSGKLAKPLVVTEQNSDRLYYRDDRLINPFAGNMTAWLRKGYLDDQGKLVTQDRLVKDNVVLTFDGSAYLKVFTRNLPNHQTAKFPDTNGSQGYNPNYIGEHSDTYYLALDPKPNAKAVAMNDRDQNGALNMGPVGIAVNGVVFYNPFDAGMIDAANSMDRCCGHPSQDSRYHYHKYPICVNTPFVDKGERHSGIIGFALDGLPVYGPYESKGEMARDSTSNPLNAFNAHYDPIRGWHYHVTPGKFPYLIGGYFALSR